MKRIYLDYAATTPLDKRVSRAMRGFELVYFGNPNSIHREGQQARARIDTARADIAKFIHAKPQEIIFTSGATEANNFALRGVISNALRNLSLPAGSKPHIITTQLEHHSVYRTVKTMAEWGIIDATFIKPTREGLISTSDVIREITANTILVSIIFVSNEIGSILPIREIGKALAEINARQTHSIYFHTDGVQAIKYLNCHVEKLGVDLMTFSAHKISGPKGIGALYIKTGTKIDNLMTGGSQEYDMRPGTQNTTGIIGFAEAVKLLGSLDDRQTESSRIQILRDKLLIQILKLPNTELNGPTELNSRIADNINVTIQGFDSDLLLSKLDLAGIGASTGSACVSGSTEPSHVIQALGKVSPQGEVSTIRLTLGRQTTASEINSAKQIFKDLFT